MDRSREGATKKIYERVLKEIKPSDLEVKAMTYKVNGLMSRLKKIVPHNVELRVVGSIARGTNLKGDGDIDIFMLFNKKLDRDRIVKLGLEYGKKVIKKEKGRYEIKYAEHPYVRLYLDSLGMKVDLVPALKIDDISEMGTTVDRTPLHTEFINSSLSSAQRDDVRLLKYLLKAHGIYGAEVKTNGFSGYLCELLIHHYGSLNGLLSAAVKFRLPLTIEPKSKSEEHSDESAKKFNSKFVVIDPVDANRNVAAGVSLSSLAKFVLVARQFTEKPSAGIFYKKGLPTLKAGPLLKKFAADAGLDMFLIVCNVKDKSEDIIHPQLRKASQQITKYLEHSGFAVYLSTQAVVKSKGLIFIVAPKQCLNSRLLKGPSAFLHTASQNFINGHKGCFGFIISESDLYALEKNKTASISDALKKLPNTIRSKDVDLKKPKLIVNSVPAEYSAVLYEELQKSLSI